MASSCCQHWDQGDSGVKCRWKKEDEMESSEVKSVSQNTHFQCTACRFKPKSEETKQQKLRFKSQLPAMLCKYTESRLLGVPSIWRCLGCFSNHLHFIPGLAPESGGCNQISQALCELHFNKAINFKMSLKYDTLNMIGFKYMIEVNRVHQSTLVEEGGSALTAVSS